MTSSEPLSGFSEIVTATLCVESVLILSCGGDSVGLADAVGVADSAGAVDSVGVADSAGV
ncbi:hypothetical protein BRC85_09295 [Halobacteriales archaeon QS_1_69_70]|nr:MAG: hypothetical protein BRC85_09295 [Halobacteriales archaeon QS_1_69_70]